MARFPIDMVRYLDDTPAPPVIRAEIAYRILGSTNYRDSDIINDLMIGYGDNFPNICDLEKLTTLLSEFRDNSPPPMASAFHLAWGLLPRQDRLDGHLAEYYYEWAKDLGISEDIVSDIIRDVVRDPRMTVTMGLR